MKYKYGRSVVAGRSVVFYGTVIQEIYPPTTGLILREKKISMVQSLFFMEAGAGVGAGKNNDKQQEPEPAQNGPAR